MPRSSWVVAGAIYLLLAPHLKADPPASAQPDKSAVLARSLAAAEQRLGPGSPNLLPILALSHNYGLRVPTSPRRRRCGGAR